jgi:hypothetical protein
VRDWCAWFREIEADPHKLHNDLTVKDLIAAREHIGACDSCNCRVERVLAKAPKTDSWASQN